MGQALDYTKATPTTPPTAFETGFDIGDTVEYLGQPCTVMQVIVGATAADPIWLNLQGEGVQATVDAKFVMKKKKG